MEKADVCNGLNITLSAIDVTPPSNSHHGSLLESLKSRGRNRTVP